MTDDRIFEDRRVLDLRYRIPVAQISNFFSGLGEGKVRGTRCKRCGSLYFPPRSQCSYCMGEETEWVDLKGDATLDTFTVIEVAPTSFAGEGRYVVAVGALDDGPKVLSWLNEKELEKIRIGMRIRLRAVKKQDGYLSYEFFPV